MAHQDNDSKDVILSHFDFRWALLCVMKILAQRSEKKIFCKKPQEKERHLDSITEGGVAPGVCEDLLADELVHDVGQVGHHEQGDHGQGEVRGLQR